MLLRKLGHLMDAFLPTIMHITVAMATVADVLLGHRDNLAPHVINPLKAIRQNATLRLIQVCVTPELAYTFD